MFDGIHLGENQMSLRLMVSGLNSKISYILERKYIFFGRD